MAWSSSALGAGPARSRDNGPRASSERNASSESKLLNSVAISCALPQTSCSNFPPSDASGEPGSPSG
eukprot:7047156-Alexandrium_andersonii.AAC.1